jgi:hypothetical protein
VAALSTDPSRFEGDLGVVVVGTLAKMLLFLAVVGAIGYDAISVTAAGPRVPQELFDQLAVGGRLVIPVGDELCSQNLLLIERTGPNEFAQTNVCPVRFVPLVGARGWNDELGTAS